MKSLKGPNATTALFAMIYLRVVEPRDYNPDGETLRPQNPDGFNRLETSYEASRRFLVPDFRQFGSGGSASA
jgi:hypothetical protein